SEKIRKMIKKVGEEMAADPELGPAMMEPLKGKLYRIAPGVKIFRCKFRTAPRDQSVPGRAVSSAPAGRRSSASRRHSSRWASASPTASRPSWSPDEPEIRNRDAVGPAAPGRAARRAV